MPDPTWGWAPSATGRMGQICCSLEHRIVAAALAATLLGGTLAAVAGPAQADSALGSTIAIVAGDGTTTRSFPVRLGLAALLPHLAGQ